MADGPDDLRDVTLAVLAGGEGSRMGRPKAELEVAGRPLLEYLLDRWSWPGPTLLVTAPGRQHPPGWRRFTREVSDPAPGEGPLRGVLTALENLTTPLLVVAAVDMPEVEAEHFAWLANALRSSPAHDAAMLTRRSVRDAATIEPLPLALRGEAGAWLADQYANGLRSLKGLAADGAVARVAAPAHWAERTWINLNRPGEWQAFLDMHNRRATARPSEAAGRLD